MQRIMDTAVTDMVMATVTASSMGIFGFFNSKVSLRESGVLRGACDRHSHILFGVDDGIKTIEDSLEAIAAEESMGIKELWCTPHIMEDIPNTSEALRKRFEQLKAAYTGNISLNLAAEYMLDTLFKERLGEKDLLVMKDDVVLVETSAITPPFDMLGQLREVQKNGYTPLLAHPERYRYMDKEDYEELVRMGVKLQLNLPSIAGYYGKTAHEKASWMLSKEMYSAVGTDCHRVMALGEPYSRELISKDDIRNLEKIL